MILIKHIQFRRTDEPKSGARVCSCHFEDNKKENGPTILPHRSQHFSLHYLTPEKKSRKQPSKQVNQMEPLSDEPDDHLVVNECNANAVISYEEDPLDLSSKSIIW